MVEKAQRQEERAAAKAGNQNQTNTERPGQLTDE